MIFREFDRLGSMPENQGEVQQFAIKQARRLIEEGGVILEPGIEGKVGNRGSELRQKYLQEVEKTRNTPASEVLETTPHMGLTILELAQRYKYSQYPHPGELYEFIVKSERESIEKMEFNESERVSLSDLNLSPAVYYSLSRVGSRSMGNIVPQIIENTLSLFIWSGLPSIQEAGSLAMRTESELLEESRVGRVAIGRIRNNLSILGLELATS